jgi:hypothetical protein
MEVELAGNKVGESYFAKPRRSLFHFPPLLAHSTLEFRRAYAVRWNDLSGALFA